MHVSLAFIALGSCIIITFSKQNGNISVRLPLKSLFCINDYLAQDQLMEC